MLVVDGCADPNMQSSEHTQDIDHNTREGPYFTGLCLQTLGRHINCAAAKSLCACA